MLPENETQAPAGEADAILKLEKQDIRNREIAVENIVDDTRKYCLRYKTPSSQLKSGNYIHAQNRMEWVVEQIWVA